MAFYTAVLDFLAHETICAVATATASCSAPGGRHRRAGRQLDRRGDRATLRTVPGRGRAGGAAAPQPRVRLHHARGRPRRQHPLAGDVAARTETD
ncbi:MAG: hypothetical protein R3A10_13420 [Caldilineaceae bacterium]